MLALSFNVESARAADEISLSGTIEPVSCLAVCGACCGTHIIDEAAGVLSVLVGNSFAPLDQINDGLSIHHFTGRYYETSGSCNTGQCTLFQIETIDQPRVSEPSYDTATGELTIPSAVITQTGQQYQLILTPPYAIGSLIELTGKPRLRQEESCAEPGAQCENGTACLSYYGIAGPSGPLFKTCEIPCAYGSCPSGQSCVTISDGPGQVCRIP